MAKFRKKPVVIEAWPVSNLSQASKINWPSLPKQVSEAYEKGDVIFIGDGSIEIKTLEGWHKANVDDMVICGVAGELYPCKPDIFAKTYEVVEE
jgi:hypothetical protein